MGIVSELRRRNVFRMAVLYAVAAWFIMQVAEVMMSVVGLPVWASRAIFAVLAIGFPIALIFSWFYEVTPEGITLEKHVDRAESITHITGRRLDFIVISMLVAAVILFAYDKWWIDGPPSTSIAVLPFVNMSDDASNEYFSDGISEELLNSLVRIPELRVIGRTSSFSYKGKDVSIVQIGRELDVSHILEGSVRKSGQNVRITAQLIDARTDTHLWSETYDRSLSDIFTIQDEIARSVVSQLMIRLVPESLPHKTSDTEAYALFLQAGHAASVGAAYDYENSIALYKKSIEIDPDFAASWDGLANVYVNQAAFGLRPADEAYADAKRALSNALEIDPDYAGAHARLGWIAMTYGGDLSEAARHFERALILSPVDPFVLADAAVFAALLGRLDTAINLNQRVVARDPLAPATFNLALTYLWAGKYDEARSNFQKRLSLRPNHVLAHYYIGISLMLEGKPEAALEEIDKEPVEVWRLVGLAMAYYAAGQITEADATLATLRDMPNQIVSYNLAHVMAFRGDVDQAFEWLDRAYESGDPNLSEILGEPLFANLRGDPRWKAFLQKIDRDPAQLAQIQFSVNHLDAGDK